VIFDSVGNRKYLTCAERKEFLCHTRNDHDLRRRAFCLTLYYTGCRVSEALNLDGASIDFSDRTIIFRTLKRRQVVHFRAIPVPNELVTVLRKIVRGREKVWPYSRTTAWRIVKFRMNQAGIQGTMSSPKGLRHGFAIACLSAKIPLTTVKKWLGHARLETTAIYLDAGGNEERELAKRIW